MALTSFMHLKGITWKNTLIALSKMRWAHHKLRATESMPYSIIRKRDQEMLWIIRLTLTVTTKRLYLKYNSRDRCQRREIFSITSSVWATVSRSLKIHLSMIHLLNILKSVSEVPRTTTTILKKWTSLQQSWINWCLHGPHLSMIYLWIYIL